MPDHPPALLIAGPTCSGKSALALALARAVGGTVINADAMQVYRELRVLTARPTQAEEAAVPHRLYGVRPAAEPGSAAWWREAALAEMAAATASGRIPILCGGTGLYFATLRHGLADIPDPGAPARAEARALLAAEGAAPLHARLAQVDPETAARQRPQDGQRVARAWEVWRGTGRGLSAWQHPPPNPGPKQGLAGPLQGSAAPAPYRLRAVLLDPERPALRAAIAARFAAMLGQGALEEVRALLAQGLDQALPVLRAHGVPELAAHLRDGLPLETAAARAVAATSRYVKRQATWFRHHALTDHGATHTIHARYAFLEQFSQREWRNLVNFLQAQG